MKIEPRPRLGQRKTFVLGILLGASLVGLFTLHLWAPTSTLEGNLQGTKIFLFQQPAVWYRTGAVALVTSLFTISVYEILSGVLQWSFWVRTDRKTFDQFWGDDASDRCSDGIILLQADKIDVLLEEYGIFEIKDKIDSQPKGRLYKARDWMNFFDAEGARAVIKEFRDLGLDPPHVAPVHRYVDGADALPSAAPPFTVIMGLGFSVKTDALMENVCAGWMKIRYMSQYGDALDLLHNLVPDKLDVLQSIQSDDEAFRTILPIGDWKLSTWLAQKPASNDEEANSARDYALIMRHTEIEPDGRRHVKFVLAGFTERGTAAAGKYLAKNWRALWSRRVRDYDGHANLGDFAMLIEGPSHYKDIKQWREEKGIKMITPEYLAKSAHHLDSVWVKRGKNES